MVTVVAGTAGIVCPCDIYHCICPALTKEECLTEPINADISVLPDCIANNCTCPANHYLFVGMYSNCCPLLECVPVCPTCPTAVCDPTYQDLIEYPLVGDACCPPFGCVCKNSSDLEFDCLHQWNDVTCEPNENKTLVGYEPGTYNCCEHWECECTACINGSNVILPNETIDLNCMTYECVSDGAECFHLIPLQETNCTVQQACANESYALMPIGYNETTCCNEFECQCIYYNYYGQNYSVGDSFRNPNNTCDEFIVTNGDPCPDLIIIPPECPEIWCGPCEKKVPINMTNCCGPEYECQSICPDTLPECLNGSIVVTDYICDGCCPTSICLSNCSDYACPKPPECPMEYLGLYPVTSTVISGEFDNCSCPIYGNCTCKDETCINPLTNEIMFEGQEVMSTDNCVKYNCTSNKDDLGCNQIELIIELCEEECEAGVHIH